MKFCGCLSVTCLNLKLASQYYLCKRCWNCFGVISFIEGTRSLRVVGQCYLSQLDHCGAVLPRPIVPELDAIVLSVWKYASFWFRLNFLRFKYIQLEPTWYFDHFCSEITSKSLKIYIVVQELCQFFNVGLDNRFKWPHDDHGSSLDSLIRGTH